MTPITPAQREERMKRDQQDLVRLATELAAAIEQRDWHGIDQLCERLTELSNDIKQDSYHTFYPRRTS